MRIDSNWGFIDSDGRFVVNPRFSAAGSFSNDLAPVQVDSQWGFIDKKGNLKIKPQFQRATSFSGDLAAVQEDSLWGFINDGGQFEINPVYDNVSAFSEGLAPVQKDGSWGYINLKGKLVIPYQYNEAGGFSNDVARVVSGDQVRYISPKGKDAGIGVNATLAAAPVPVVVKKTELAIASPPEVKPAPAPQPTPVVVPVPAPTPKPQTVVSPSPKAKPAAAPLKTGDASPGTADIEPLGTLWQKALLPKHRAIISFMDPDASINTFRGTDAYFAYNDGSSKDGKIGYTDQNNKFVPVTIPSTLDNFGNKSNRLVTTKSDLKLDSDNNKSRVFSFAQAAGVVPQTFKTSVSVMGTDTFDGVPIGMIASSYLTKDDEDGTKTYLWIDLAGRIEKDQSQPITKDTTVKKLAARIKLEEDADKKELPRPYYRYKFNADGSIAVAENYKPVQSYLSVGLSHDMVAWDWNNDGYTDYVVSYVTNPGTEKDYKSMKVAVVFIDGKSLYDASQGNGKVKFWVDKSTEYTTGGDVVGGLTDVKPPNSVRMAIGDLDGDSQPEVALYFTKVCGPSGLAHNNTLRILKLAYQNQDEKGRIINMTPNWNWVISEASDYGKWYLQQDSVALAIGDLDGNKTNELVLLHGNTKQLYDPSRVYIDVYNLAQVADCDKDGTNCQQKYSLTHSIDSSDFDKILKTSQRDSNKNFTTYPVLQASIADLDGNGTGELIWVGTTDEKESDKLQLNVRSWKKFDPANVTKDNKPVTTLSADNSKNYNYELADWKLDSDYIRYAMTAGRFVYPENIGNTNTVALRNQIGIVSTAPGSDDAVGLHWGIISWGCEDGPCSSTESPAFKVLGSGQQKNVVKGINIGPSIVAADLDGDSMIIGQGVKVTITDSTQTLFNIQAPPKHYDEFTYNGVAYKMDAFSTLKDYKTKLSLKAEKSQATSTTDISQGKFDYSMGYSYLNISTEGNNVPPPYVSAGYQMALDWVNDTLNFQKIDSDVDLTSELENDDRLIYRSNTHDLWRYPILYPPAVATQSVAVVDPNTGQTNMVQTQAYIQFVVPQKVDDTNSIISAWGKNVSWYQPRHNNLNLFSYPASLVDILGYPQGVAAKKADDWWKNINGTPLVTMSGQTIGGLNNGELGFSLGSDSSQEKTKNFKGTIGGYLNLAPEIGRHALDFDASGDGSFGTDSVTTTDASNLMQITVTTPGVGGYEGQSDPNVPATQQNFTVDGSVYTTDSGVYTLGFAVTSLKNRTSKMWGAGSPYQMAADPALNLPRMYTMEKEKWVPNRLADPSTGLDVSNSHEIRGIQFTNADYFTVTNLNGQAIPVNTPVSSTIRIYNYSFVKTGQITVNVLFQSFDDMDTPPDVTKAELLTTATLLMIPGRESGANSNNWADMKVNWTTPQKTTYGYLHVVLLTPATDIEKGTGKAIMSGASSGSPVYGGGNLNPNNDQGYVLVGIYDPQSTTTATQKPVKSGANTLKAGATAPSGSASSSKTLKIVTDSLAVRPIKNSTLEASTTTLSVDQKAIIQAKIRFDDEKGDKKSAVTRVHVYLRDGKRIVGHKVLPLMFNGKEYTVRMPYTAPGNAQSVPLEMVVSSAALPLGADSAPKARLANTVLTINQP